MTGREERIQAEAAALWRELYDEPPPIRAQAAEMLDVILKDLPDVSYERIASAHLRRSTLTWARSN